MDPDDEVILDYTDLVEGAYYEEEDDLRALALQSLGEEYVRSEKLIVLTEGPVDAEVLQKTLEVRYPHLRDYVSFPDFHGSNAQGSAGSLANLVKAFAGSGIPNRVVALFDNDAAGHDAMRGLQGAAVPANIKTLALPHLPYAESYPTVGAQGASKTDVNGRACSLELYFGSDVLEDDGGNPPPVQWGGLVRSLNRHQGAVADKRALRGRYLEAVQRAAASTEAYAEHDWAPMERVFDMIFKAFEQWDVPNEVGGDEKAGGPRK